MKIETESYSSPERSGILFFLKKRYSEELDWFGMKQKWGCSREFLCFSWLLLLFSRRNRFAVKEMGSQIGNTDKYCR